MDNPSRKIFATDLRAPEGPTFDRDGNLYVVEMAAGRIARIDPTGRVSIFTEDGGGPNGMALGADGCLYVCNNGGYSVPQEQRQSPRIERIFPKNPSSRSFFSFSNPGSHSLSCTTPCLIPAFFAIW